MHYLNIVFQISNQPNPVHDPVLVFHLGKLLCDFIHAFVVLINSNWRWKHLMLFKVFFFLDLTVCYDVVHQ